MQKTARNILLWAVVLAGAAVLFCFPQPVLTGASRGLSLCGNVLIPSLLPFLTLVGVCMRSGLGEAAGALLKRPTAVLFRLPAPAAAPILFAFLGGYPAGAVAVKQLLEEGNITPNDAKRMMHFCVGAGPAFAVAAVGGVMLGNSRAGWVLLLAHLLSAWTVGFAEARRAPLSVAPASLSHHLPLAAAFTSAVGAAVQTLVSMSGFVILFSVCLSLADGTGLTAFLDRYIAGGSVMLAGLLEVTAGCTAAAGAAVPLLFLVGFFLSFGGLSVHCQVRSILQKHPAVLKDFFLFRLLHGLLGGGLTVLLFAVLPDTVSVLAPDSTAVKPFMVSPTVSLVFLCMGVALLVSGKKRLPTGEKCDMV